MVITIDTITGKVTDSDFESDAKALQPKRYEMPDLSKYDEPQKNKRERKASKKPKVKMTPVKELKAEVYTSLKLADGDNDGVKQLAGFSFFNSDKGKYDSLVARKTWESIIEALQDDNFGTKSNDWVEFYNQQQASKTKPKTENKKSVDRPKGSKNKTEKTKTATGEPTLKVLKTTVYELLGVNDTQSAKDKAKELGIDIKDLSLRSKLGWESFRKRTVKKLTPPVEKSPIVSVDKHSESPTTETVVVTAKATSEVLENDLDSTQSLEAKLAFHWSRTRAEIYKELKSQNKTTKQTQSITRMLQQCKKELEVQDFNEVLEVNGLSQFIYKAS